MRNLSVFVSVVLVFGLCSCIQDKEQKKQVDPFRAQPPIVKTNGGEESIKSLADRLNQNLDILDVIDTSQSKSLNTAIRANCVVGDQKLVLDYQGPSRNPVPILQLLPESVLVEPKIDLNCDFEFTLSNEIGSRHIFNLQNIRVQNQRAPNLVVDSDVHSIGQLRMRYPNSGPAAVELVCRNARFASLPFEMVREIGDFDFAKPIFPNGSAGSELLQRPIQTCRAFIRQEGRFTAYSPVIKLQIPRPGIGMEFLSSPHRETGDPIPSHKWTFDVTRNPQNIVFGDYRASNPLPVARKVRLLNVPREFRLCLLADQPTVVTRPWIQIFPLEAQSAEIFPDGEGWTMVLQPGGSVLIRAELQPPHGWKPFPDSARGMKIEALGSLSLMDLDEDGQTVGQMNFPLGDALMAGQFPHGPVRRAQFNEQTCPQVSNTGYVW